MSVDLERLIEEAGLDARVFVVRPPFVGAVRFTAGMLRGGGFHVGYDPLTENPYHGEVWGIFSRSKQRWLAAVAGEFVQPPPG